jgi:hypothetical protein
LFNGCGRRPKSLCEILRLRREQIDSIEQGWVRMQQARVTQNRDCLIEMSIVSFQLCELQ